MANTRQNRRMTCNSWAQLTHPCKNLFGRLGPLWRSSKLLLGRHFKIGFERRSIWKRAGGIIVVLALYANKPRNWCITSFSIAVTPPVFCMILRYGSASRRFNHHNGKVLQSRIGGASSRTALLQIARPCFPSPFSCCRKFVVSATLGFLETSCPAFYCLGQD
jgi:hypothetical protein